MSVLDRISNGFKYLDKNGLEHLIGKTERLFRFTSMPAAGAGFASAPVQYIGATTADYTNGYYYKSVLNGAIYEWQQVNVQPGSSQQASSVFVGTAADWTAEQSKTDYDIAVLTDTHFVLAVDKTDGTTTEVANLNKIFRGTQAEWDALTQQEQDYYDQAEIEETSYVAVPGTLIVAHDLVVAVADWQVDQTYSDFGYKAEIPIADVTANYSPDVRMQYDDIKNGTISPVADATSGKVIIYASAVPATDITIPAIICTLMSV